MPFESGSTALVIANLSSKLPDDFLERLAANGAGRLDDVKAEPVIGWVSGRHLLENEINEATAICGGHLYLNLRKAERKIPSALLKAICRREELAYMQANDTAAVPSKERKRIKAEVIERNLMKMPPSFSATPFVIDIHKGVMFAGTASLKQLDNLIALFHKSLEVEPVPLTINELMIRTMKGAESDLPSLSFCGASGKDADPVPARDFLTWLWYFTEEKGGKIKVEGEGDFEAMVEGPLAFAFPTTEAKGAAESSVKKGGCPQVSAEAKAALAVGKKLKKCKLTIARGQEVWAGTFDADKLAFTGLTLPEGEEMERNARFAERVDKLHTFSKVIEAYFKLFAETVLGAERAALEKNLRKWAQDRESY